MRHARVAGADARSRRASAEEVASDGGVCGEPVRAGVAILRPDAKGAVIIPAHNEAGVIARTLSSLAPLARLAGVEVLVVCNGCDDDTASIARTFREVTVVELERGSKTLALNAGDALATRWPRLYLDADIEIDPVAVVALFDAFDDPNVLAARPSYSYNIHGATWPVRAYYRARSRIPAPSRRLWGAGGYAVGEIGHRRFNSFPDVTSDDCWIDEQFAPGEKRIVATLPALVRTPRDTRALLAVLSRQRRGYREIGIRSAASSRGRGLLASVRGPGTAADAVCYVTLSLISRRRAAKSVGQTTWERDSSSREAPRDTPTASHGEDS